MVHFEVALSNIIKFQYFAKLFTKELIPFVKKIPISNESYQTVCKNVFDMINEI